MTTTTVSPTLAPTDSSTQTNTKRNELEQFVLDTLVRIDPEGLDVDSVCQQPNRPLIELMELDSMGFLDIVMEIRKKYKLTQKQIPEEDYGQLTTLNGIVNYCLPKISQEVTQTLHEDRDGTTGRTPTEKALH